MHVRCHSGRVVKCEGNPNHPVSRGGLCPRGQSAPQGLYDPDRVRGPLYKSGGEAADRVKDKGGKDSLPPFLRSSLPGFVPATWTEAIHEASIALAKAKRLFIISNLQTGALAEAMRRFHAAMGLPGEVVFYEAFAYEALRSANAGFISGADAQSGEPGRGPLPRYRLQDCDLILSFGADFLETWISNVEFAWQFARMHHRLPDYRGEMIYIGPRLSMTAANADFFLQIPAGQEVRVALAILREATGGGPISSPIGGISPEAIREIAGRFMQAKNSVALGGPAAAAGPAAERLATAVMLLNQAAGRIGTTVDFSQTHALGSTIPASQLGEMLADLGQGDLVIFHETNPAYSLPETRKYLERAGRIIYLGTMMNETAAMADWFLPVLSPLEAWGDYEPWSGVHCLMQPTMGPLQNVQHSGDLFLSLASMFGRPLEAAGQQVTTFRDWLMLRWGQLRRQFAPDMEFEAFWREALRTRRGVYRAGREAGGRRISRHRPPSRSRRRRRPRGCNCGSGRRFSCSTGIRRIGVGCRKSRSE